MKLIQIQCEKCPNTEVFLVRIFRIRTEYVQILRIPLYSARMQENKDQKSLRILTLSRSEIFTTADHRM